MALEKKVENIIWPKESGRYKIVQFLINNLPYLRFSEFPVEKNSNIYHQFILRDFAIEIGVGCRKVKNQINDDVYVLPEGKQYKTPGMGKCDIDIENKTACFFGDSFNYGLTPDKEHLKSIEALSPDWKITIEK